MFSRKKSSSREEKSAPVDIKQPNYKRLSINSRRVGKYSEDEHGKQSHVIHLHNVAIRNDMNRSTIYTTPQMQVCTRSLPPRGEVEMETHSKTTQLIRIESGCALVIIGPGVIHTLKEGDTIIIENADPYKVQNRSTSNALKLSIIYSPPEHDDLPTP